MLCRISLNQTISVLGSLLMLIPVLTGGCAASWGSFKNSPELALQFDDKGLDPSFTYYYCGRSNLPYAVVGVDKAYAFESDVWFKIESMDEVYDKIHHLANLERGQYQRYAKQILTRDGQVAGTYFSYYPTTAVKVDPAAKIFWIGNPHTESECCRKF